MANSWSKLQLGNYRLANQQNSEILYEEVARRKEKIKDQKMSLPTQWPRPPFLPKMIPDALHASTSFPIFLKSFHPLSSCQLSSLDAPFSFL